MMQEKFLACHCAPKAVNALLLVSNAINCAEIPAVTIQSTVPLAMIVAGAG